jgi:hypothetical protein
MSEEEFDLMDELYFVRSYGHLKKELDWEHEKLLATLQSLLEKEWIKCFSSPDEEVFKNYNLPKFGKEYFYLATKKGLMEHNSI